MQGALQSGRHPEQQSSRVERRLSSGMKTSLSVCIAPSVPLHARSTKAHIGLQGGRYHPPFPAPRGPCPESPQGWHPDRGLPAPRIFPLHERTVQLERHGWTQCGRNPPVTRAAPCQRRRSGASQARSTMTVLSDAGFKATHGLQLSTVVRREISQCAHSHMSNQLSGLDSDSHFICSKPSRCTT